MGPRAGADRSGRASSSVAYARRARTSLARAAARCPPGARPASSSASPSCCAALISPIDTIGEDRVFYVHMIQHLTIGELAPLLILLGLSGAMLRPLLALPPAKRLRFLVLPLVGAADLGGQPLRLAPAAALRTGARQRIRPLARARHVLPRRDADVGGADRAAPRPGLVRLRRQGDLRAGGAGARLRDPRQRPDLVGDLVLPRLRRRGADLGHLAAARPADRRRDHVHLGRRDHDRRLLLALPALAARGGAAPVAARRRRGDERAALRTARYGRRSPARRAPVPPPPPPSP